MVFVQNLFLTFSPVNGYSYKIDIGNIIILIILILSLDNMLLKYKVRGWQREFITQIGSFNN